MNPIAAHTLATIQKRRMIFVSDHPRISKWWWIGAIRKIRLRKAWNEKTWSITDAASSTKIPPSTIRSSSVFVIVGTSNAVNLTDGLDGLAIMPTVLVGSALGIFAYVAGHAVFSKYLGLPYIPGAGELAVICGALAGAGLGFLWFNAYPAEVFMGDVGALSLGAALGTIAVIVRQEIVLFIMGGVFVAETLSVMIQVLYFKYSGGKRIFRMAPLHHHYELEGWKESQVVVRFWIITMMLVLFGLSTLKLR